MKKMNVWKKTLTALAAALAIAAMPVIPARVQAANTLVWPVPNHTSLTQGYHDGSAIDIGDSKVAGATIVAAMGGTVTNKFTCTTKHYGSNTGCNGFGTGIVIKGTDGRFYQYAHMQANSIPASIQVGTSVTAGQTIGAVGTTGNSSGNHLHFGISKGAYYNQSGINPLNETYKYTSTTTPVQTNVTYGTLSVSGVTTSNAVIQASISNPGRAMISKVGANLWDANGNLVTRYTETCNRTLASFNQALNINTEAKKTLNANTLYTVQFFAITDSGKTFNSGKTSFRTLKAVSVTYGSLKTEFIKKDNAKLYAAINNPSGAKVTKVGAYIWNASGKLIKNYTETCNRTLKSFNQYLDIQKEAKLTLTKSTKYYIQFYAIADGKTFTSSRVSFTTASK